MPAFKRMPGYPQRRPGYEVDQIVPLARGEDPLGTGEVISMLQPHKRAILNC